MRDLVRLNRYARVGRMVGREGGKRVGIVEEKEIVMMWCLDKWDMRREGEER